MFAYIQGILKEVQPQKVVIETGGIGYEIKIPESLVPKLPERGRTVKLHTYFNVREDAQELYGFFDREEKSIFEKLITVTGIGPRVAMAILSSLAPAQIALAIVTGDIKALCTAPGVGKKTAQRLILELKEKIDKETLIGSAYQGSNFELLNQKNEVIEALVALGYQSLEAQRALDAIEGKDQDVSELIKASLKLMDRN
ncbi:MAG: Holliday junction branch migration protein RuvA [Clostridiales bacterium]|nr:Holliday junction branch migration protein RuvA [Clostridiales bacterium]